jgi:hypothetical protein
MNENINLNIDQRPYLPDIFINNDIYNTNDEQNMNKISINKNIFIVNLTSVNDKNSIYNDPNYILFGQKKDGETYNIPSLNYFYNYNQDNLVNYLQEEQTNTISLELYELLEIIGYNKYDINEDIFNYELLKLRDNQLIIFLYFNLKSIDSTNQIETNYNNFNSTVFYNKNYWNLLIYPFNNTVSYISPSNISYNINKIVINNLLNKINKVEFDNKDLISYKNKIDYKFLEDKTENNKGLLLKNYAINIKNYLKYFEENKSSYMISLNEIGKTYYKTSETDNLSNSYTMKILNNKHINNNINYSLTTNKFSFTMDNKLNLLENIKYDSYNYYNKFYEYQNIVVNYNLNCYYDINTESDINRINLYLYKFLVKLNPQIISLNYLLDNIVELTIRNLYNDNNNLQFGDGINKVTLSLESNVKYTNLYYINKYEIIYTINTTNINNEEIQLNYIIILSICYYNYKNISIVDLEKSDYNTILGYINYTNVEDSITLNPSIYTKNSNLYVLDFNFNLDNLKNKIFKINFNTFNNKALPISNKNLKFNLYYILITNSIIEFKNDNNYFNNLLNNLIININNAIKNIINISNTINFIKNNTIIENLELGNIEYIISCVLDNNISEDLIYYYEYISEIKILPEYYDSINFTPKGVYKKKLNVNNENKNFKYLPSGYYKVLNYTNLKPKKLLVEGEDDELVESLKSIIDIEKYNFCLMIKLPNNFNIDDSLYKDDLVNNNNIFKNNYNYNIGSNLTELYLVPLNENNKPYKFLDTNLLLGIKLFNSFNIVNDQHVLINLLINQYINFYQMNFVITVYQNYIENNNYIIDSDKLRLRLHNNYKLSDIVYYDFQRFINSYDKQLIENEYKNYDESITLTLYNNKVKLQDYVIIIKKLLIYLNNQKIIILLYKVRTYLNILKSNFLLNFTFENDEIIQIIKLNMYKVNKLIINNYNLNITYSSTSSFIYQNLIEIINITLNVSLEDINNYEIYVNYSLSYFKKKNEIISSKMFLVINNDENDIYISIKNVLYDLIIENLIFNQILEDIELININYNIGLSSNDELLLIEVVNYLKLVLLNSKKIDEILNICKLISLDETLDNLNPNGLNDNVVKNTYLYNTEYYNNQLNTKNYKIERFLKDLYNIILRLSDNTNSFYLVFVQILNEGFETYINDTINCLNTLIEYIIGIYKFIYSENNFVGVIPPIDIYDETVIADIYFKLTEFINNYEKIFEILDKYDMNILFEIYELRIFLGNFVYEIKEFLLYIQIKKDYDNHSIDILNGAISINIGDLINKFDLNDVIDNIENNINDIFFNYNIDTILLFINNIKEKDYINNPDYNLINNNIKHINFYYYDIIYYNDLNIMNENYNNELITNYNIFNFNNSIIDIIKLYNIEYKNIIDLYNNTYSDEKNIFYKTLINYNYLQNPYIYININDAFIYINLN